MNMKLALLCHAWLQHLIRRDRYYRWLKTTNSVPKLLKLFARLVAYTVIGVALYFLYKYLFPFDLMHIVLVEQNLTRFHVTCNSSELEKHLTSVNNINNNKIIYLNALRATVKNQLISGNQFEDIIEIYDNFYMNGNKFDDKQLLDIEYALVKANNVPPPSDETNNNGDEAHKPLAVANSFRICVFNPNAIHLLQKPHAEQSGTEKSLVEYLFVSQLSKRELERFGIDAQLAPGGYYKPMYCIQEFLIYLKHRSKHYLDTTMTSQLDAILTSIRDSAQEAKYAFDNWLGELCTSVLALLNSVAKQSAFTNTSAAAASLLLRKRDDSAMQAFNEFAKYKRPLTAIVVPYLRREKNLAELLVKLHPFLQRQFIHYRIFVAEQHNAHHPWNKGRLYNKAFEYIKENYPNVNCFIMHDVDLIPESDYNLYQCDNVAFTPRHLSKVILRNENYILPDSYKESAYELLIGGVLCIKPPVYERINGFSNEFWEWGAEDDGSAYFYIFA